MKIICFFKNGNPIVEHEDKMFEKYSQIVSKYSVMFAKYNCSLNIERSWINLLENINSKNRLPFKNGYSCYIYCNVEKNGEVVRYENGDGEVDFYEVSTLWCVSSISRFFFRLKVMLWTETNEVEKEITRLLRIVEGQSGDG